MYGGQTMTMGVDGENLWYNPDFVEKLSDSELLFVIGHEVIHMALGHLRRQDTRQPMKWNVAIDFAANIIVEDARIGNKPDGVLYDTNYKDMSAEQIYASLPENAGKDYKAFDIHLPGKPLPEEEDDKKKKCSGGGSKSGTEPSGPVWKGLTDEEAQDWKGKVAAAAQAHERTKGNLPGSLRRFIDELLEPKLPWQALLARFVSERVSGDYRWLPPNRRHIHSGLYLPSNRTFTLNVVIGIDSSGSISDEEFAEFMSEVRGILATYDSTKGRVFVCDTQVHDRYDLDEEVRYVKRSGGTCFEPVFDAVEDEQITPACLIYFTDGYGSFPEEPDYPTLWISTTDYDKYPFGEVIRMEAHD